MKLALDSVTKSIKFKSSTNNPFPAIYAQNGIRYLMIGSKTRLERIF